MYILKVSPYFWLAVNSNNEEVITKHLQVNVEHHLINTNISVVIHVIKQL